MSSAKAIAFAFHQWETLDEDVLPTAARLVLMSLANFCNEHFESYPARGTLAKLASCSLDTVDRHLRILERLGLIARIRRERMNGASTSATNVILIGPAQHDHARSLGWKPPGLDPQDVVGGPHGAALPPEPEGGRTVRLGGPHGAAPVITEPKNLEDSPRAPRPEPEAAAEGPAADPPLGVAPALAGPPPAGSRRRWDPDIEGADAFLASWPGKSIDDAPEPVRRAWARLTDDERKEARRGVATFREAEGRAKRRPCSAVNYLRDRRWQALDVLKAGRRDGTAPAAMVFVRKGTPAFEAWRRHLVAIGTIQHWQPLFASFSRDHGTEGTWQATLFPPGRTAEPAAPRGEDPAEVSRLLAGE